MSAQTDTDYTASGLSARYGIEIGEATRLIARFGRDRKEIDLLLGARDRSVQLLAEDEAATALL